jgi:hypothetical protein
MVTPGSYGWGYDPERGAALRRQYGVHIRYRPEAWSEDWEAAECQALREIFGVTDRLERAPRVADDADIVWLPAPNALGFRGYHEAMWAPELRRAAYRVR